MAKTTNKKHWRYHKSSANASRPDKQPGDSARQATQNIHPRTKFPDVQNAYKLSELVGKQE